MAANSQPQHRFHEVVELRGHIIDSLILPKVLDEITTLGGEYESQDIRIGHHRHDPSYVRLEVRAPTEECLETILVAIGQHGAVPVTHQDCRIVTADIAGAFPEGFYATTNEPTEIRVGGHWIPVERQEMDCGIRVDLETRQAVCIALPLVAEGARRFELFRQGQAHVHRNKDREHHECEHGRVDAAARPSALSLASASAKEAVGGRSLRIVLQPPSSSSNRTSADTETWVARSS